MSKKTIEILVTGLFILQFVLQVAILCATLYRNDDLRKKAIAECKVEAIEYVKKNMDCR